MYMFAEEIGGCFTKTSNNLSPLSDHFYLLFTGVCALIPFLKMMLKLIDFQVTVKTCYSLLLIINQRQKSVLHAPCWRKLISWVCHTAMRALRATGSCYHSQVRYADKLTMTAEPSHRCVCVCVRICVCPLCALESVYVCVLPQPEDRNLSMAAEIVSIPEIPPDSKQPATRREGERGMREREREREREASCQICPLCNEHRCNISQDKGSSVLRNKLLYSHDMQRILRGSRDTQLWEASVQKGQNDH